MKKVFLNVMLICLVFVAVSCGGGLKTKVVGSWETTKVDGEAPKNSTVFTLGKDGSFEISIGSESIKGKYELDEKNKMLVMKPENSKEEKQNITEIKVEKDIMTFINGGKKIELKKK